MIVYPDKNRVHGKFKVCHPGIIKKMLMNLQKLEYTDTSSREKLIEFGKQYNLIYEIFWTEYYLQNELYKNAYVFFTVQLLKFLNVDDCILNKAYVRIQFTKYAYDLVVMIHWLYIKLEKCKGKKVLVPLILEFDESEESETIESKYRSAHANLLIFDTNTKKVYRVEPNVGFSIFENKYNTAITNKLEILSKKFGFEYAGYFPSSCKKMGHPGLCMFLSVLKYTNGIELTNTQVKEIIVSFFKSEYNRLCFKQLK